MRAFFDAIVTARSGEFFLNILTAGIGAFLAVWINDWFKRRSRWELYAEYVWKERVRSYPTIMHEILQITGKAENVAENIADPDEIAARRASLRESVTRLTTLTLENSLIMSKGLFDKLLELTQNGTKALAEACDGGSVSEETMKQTSRSWLDLVNAMRSEIHLDALPPTEQKKYRREIATKTANRVLD